MEYKILSDGGIESRMNIPMRQRHIIVAGGGVAGCAAALGAADNCSVYFENPCCSGTCDARSVIGLCRWTTAKVGR